MAYEDNSQYEIPMFGVLNAATVEGIVAKAEQIRLNLPTGDKTTVSEYVRQNAQFKTGESIRDYIIAQTDYSALFICTEDSEDFKKKHIYYYDGASHTYEDLTPEGSGGGSGGSIGGRPVLTIKTTIKKEYTTDEVIEIEYYWESLNTGYGRCYYILDGQTVASKREMPCNVTGESSRTWTIGRLQRGKHTVEMYVTDSASISSSPRYTATINVGSLEVETTFNQDNYYPANKDLTIPYSVYNSSNLPHTVYYSFDNGDFMVSEESPITITSAMMTDGVHNLQIYAETSEKVSNTLSLNIIAALPGRVYVTAVSNTAQTEAGPTYASTEAGQQITFRTNIVELNGRNFTTTYYLYPADESYNKLSGTGDALVTVKQSLGINSFTHSFNEGYYILEVKSTSNTTPNQGSCVFKLHILPSKLYSVDSIVDDSLILWLDAKGKLNSAVDKTEWLDKANNSKLEKKPTVTLHNFNYTTNGWIMNEDGTSQNCLLINSRAYATIDLEPFKSEITNGLTVDIEFSTRDVSNENARVISCYSAPRGFFINTDTARIGSSASPTETKYEDKEVVDETGYKYIVSTKTGPFELNFRQDVRTHLTFVIYRYNEKTNTYPISVMAIYLNGILAGLKEIGDNDSFITNKGQIIYLGCNPNLSGELENFGECKIYNLRVYDRALDYTEIVTNMLSDIEDPVKKDEQIRRNKIGPASTDSTLLVPEMTFTMFDKDFKNISKSDRQKAIITYRAPSGTTTSLEDFGTVQWQGTSTLAYAVKNYKINLYKQTDYSGLEGISLGNMSEQEFLFNNLKKYGKKHKINIGNGQVESKFTLKADYMDSSNSHNCGLAMFIPEMKTEETPIQKYLPSCRTSVYGFPMKLMLNRVPDDAVNNGVPDEGAGTTEVLGIYNFLLDKGCTDSLGLWDKNDIHDELRDNNYEMDDNGVASTAFDHWKKYYPYWDCLSFEISANSDNSAGAFNRSDYESVIQDFEYRFPDEDDIAETQSYGKYEIIDNVLTLEVTNKYKLLDDGSIDKKGDISNNLITNTYTKDEDGNFVSAEYTLRRVTDTNYVIDNVLSYENGEVKTDTSIEITFLPDPDALPGENKGHIIFTESLGQIYMDSRVHLKRVIDWVRDSSDDEFYNDFEKHFNLSSVLDYYLMVLTLGMVDSLGKNLMFDTYGPGAVNRTYTHGNKIGEVITYTDEEKAKYDNYVWYAHFYDMDTCIGVDNSGNVRFDTDIEITQGVFNTSKSMLWTRFAKLFKTEIFNRYVELRTNGTFTIDTFMKYLYENQIAQIPEMLYNESFYSKYLSTEDRRAYLFMMHGSQYEYMYRWIEQRLYFLDTYFSWGSEYNARCTVRVEYNDYAKEPVTYNIQTYFPAYVYVIFKNSGENGASGETSDTAVRLKVGRGQTVAFSKFITTSTDQETIIYNAGNIKTFGDVSKYTPKAVIIDQAVKLTKLIVGTEEHPNPNLKQLSLGNNKYLTEIVAENCSAIDYSLNVSGCSNLERISLTGSSISSVTFPKGAPLKEVNLPAATSSIIFDSLAILDTFKIEGYDKINTINIKNCPLLTGYRDKYGNIIEGSLTNLFLDKFAPTDPLTRISIDSLYGYFTKYTFLDSIAKIALDYPENFDIYGDVRYLGNTIPQYYSSYENCFPNLKVRYPNVNNVSSMFEKYKNITLIFSRDETYLNSQGTDYITRTYYYWKDLREGEFPDSAYVTYNGEKARSVAYYDDKDSKALAAEIKKLLAPFSKFTSTNAMFKDMAVLDYLDPETFDNIDMSDCSTSYMFDGCSNLQYFEIPRTVSKINNFMFSNCYKATVFVPNTVDYIDSTGFYTNNYDIGSHTIVLFENGSSFKEKNNDPTYKYLRDARFDIKVNAATGRAKQTKDCVLINVEGEEENLKMDYFEIKDSENIYVDKIYNDSLTEVVIPTLNYDGDYFFTNPMKVSEFLPGSLRYITGLETLAAPAFGIRDAFTSDIYRLREEECSIARMFTKDVITPLTINNLPIKTLYLLSPDEAHRKVSRYFTKQTAISQIRISKDMEIIEEGAFAGSQASMIKIENDRELGDPCSLRSIGDYAFENACLNEIYIPDTVDTMGIGAFKNCQYFTSLHYSSNLTYIPEQCFMSCLAEGKIPPISSISGFSKNITNIEMRAFDGAIGLLLFKKSNYPTTTLDCEFCCSGTSDSDTSKNENINYFTNLASIGNYAFRGIANISRLDIPETLEEIGASSFIPPDGEVSNNTLLVWKPDGDYSNLHIGSQAFMGREFSYLCDKSGFDSITSLEDKIINRVCYIPNVGSIEINAFTPTIRDSSSTAKLDFVLTDRDEIQDQNDSWSPYFVTDHLRTIYNYKNALLNYDSNGYSKFLYFLTEKDGNKEALVARLINTPNTIIIDRDLTFEDNGYKITEILDHAFIENDENLTSLYFKEDSELNRIGNKIFDNLNLQAIGVIDSVGNVIVDVDEEGVSRKRLIPQTVVWSDDKAYSPIGTDNPFKMTQWFKYYTDLRDEFVYMNEYCIGYMGSNGYIGNSSEEETTIINTTKKIKNSIKVIYEKAFASDLFLSFTLPESLKRIEKQAFQYCSSLSAIDFTPCRDNLNYIGQAAFQTNASLKEVNYTYKIKYVGKDAFGNCQSIDTVSFEEGTVLSNDSYPITPILNNQGYNETIKRLVIPNSMGEFFSQSGPGYEVITTLRNLSELVLGGIAGIVELPEFDETDPDIINSYGGDSSGKYKLDLSTLMLGDKTLSELYPQAVYSGAPIKMRTNNSYFICPNTSYTYGIDLSYNKYNLDHTDVLRLILGYVKTEGKTPSIDVPRNVGILTSGAIFTAAKEGRVLFNTIIRN